MDCPVSGTGAQAATGDLIVFASGDQGAYDIVKGIFPGMSKAIIIWEGAVTAPK
ncbi:MAG: hypothetical protein EBQ70_03625 [Betaproteobacteria bacterium]|nr:hypothetical protein [Betaproteobacteria bacterium]